IEVSVDEAGEFQVRYDGIHPVGTQESRLSRERYLLVKSIVADVPQFPHNWRGAGFALACAERTTPIVSRKSGLVKVILEIEGDLSAGCIGRSGRKVVPQVNIGVVGNSAGGVWGQRACFPSITKGFIDEICSLPARPFQIADDFLAEAPGKIGAEFVLTAFAVVEQFRIEILTDSEAAFDQNAIVSVSPINRRIEAQQIHIRVNGAGAHQRRGYRQRQSATLADVLGLQHERAKPIFPQNGGIGS